MIQTKKPTGRSSSVPGGLAAGAAVSMLSTVVIAMILAKLIQSQTLAQERIGYGIMTLLFISSFLGAAVSQGRVKHRRLMVCMLSGLVYFVLLMSMTALFFGGQYSAVGVTACLVFGAAGCAGLLLAGGRGGSSKHRKIRK